VVSVKNEESSHESSNNEDSNDAPMVVDAPPDTNSQATAKRRITSITDIFSNSSKKSKV
jgi:hypothetical protein